MTAKYQAYAEYKDSGVEWFGNIPSHWRVAGFKKYIQSIVDYRGKTPNKTDHGILLVTARNIKSGSLDYTLSQEFIAEEDYDYVMSRGKPKIGDVLFTTEAPLGEVSNVDKTNIALAQRVIKFSGKKDILDNYYFKYLIMSEEFQQSLYLFASGSTVKGIKAERFVYLRKLLPPLIEQKRIANFLDHEAAKIDTLIEKQQQLIKLLKEKRQAVISHAVTKGLNPNAPMRDSGVEWLGDVPEHWIITRAKFLFDFVTSGSRGWAEYYSDEGSLFFRITNLTRDTIEPKLESIQNVRRPSGSEGERSKISKNDLLISITADLGSVCVANDEIAGGYVSQHVSLCRPNGNVASSRWLGFYILSDIAKEQLIGSGYGGTKVQLSLEDIRELWVVQPNRQDQIEIAKYIESQLDIFSKLTMRAEKQIELLQERRTALISAAVTGKIDLRNWQAPYKENKEAAL